MWAASAWRTFRPTWRPQHNAAFDPLGLDINMQLEDGGAHKFRSGKEEHLFNPQTIHLFQKACCTGDYDTFKQFTRTVDNMGTERRAPAQPAGLQL